MVGSGCLLGPAFDKAYFKRLLVTRPTREEGLDARLNRYGRLSAQGSSEY